MKNFIQYLNEETLYQIPLPYAEDALAPVKSKATIDYHFNHLASGYVKRFNNNEGDPKFNRAGAFLHNIYFAQFQKPKQSNEPSGQSADFIKTHFGTFDKFRAELKKVAMKIQGSGWVYLANDGEIKTIKNHEVRKDIVLLIDWWEHAWALDYQSDKEKYLDNIWKIINWNKINSELI